LVQFDLPLCLSESARGPLPKDIDQLDGNRAIVVRDVLWKEKNADRYRQVVQWPKGLWFHPA
jgi:hypothetical protein